MRCAGGGEICPAQEVQSVGNAREPASGATSNQNPWAQFTWRSCEEIACVEVAESDEEAHAEMRDRRINSRKQRRRIRLGQIEIVE